MASKTIKERLDALDGGVASGVFTSSSVQGWSVYTSSSGLKYAILGSDHPDLTWKKDASAIGTYICNKALEDTLPAGVFTVPPMVNIQCTSDVSSFIMTTFSQLPTGETYIGKHRVVGIDLENSPLGAVLPTKIHTVYIAIGF